MAARDDRRAKAVPWGCKTTTNPTAQGQDGCPIHRAEHRAFLFSKFPGPDLTTIIQPTASVVQISSAQTNNFRIKAANSQIGAREFESRAAQADHLPQVMLGATASVGDDLDGSYGADSRAYLGLSMNWNISNGGRRERIAALLERKNEALYERM